LFCCFPPVPLLSTQRKREAKKRGGEVSRHPSQINLKHPKKKKKKPKISPVCMMVYMMMRWWEEVSVWSKERREWERENLREPWLACLNSNTDCTPQPLMPFWNWWTWELLLCVLFSFLCTEPCVCCSSCSTTMCLWWSQTMCVCVLGGVGGCCEERTGRKEGRKEEAKGCCIVCVGFLLRIWVSFQDFIYGVVKVAIIQN
jgi:hypothetical protein